MPTRIEELLFGATLLALASLTATLVAGVAVPGASDVLTGGPVQVQAAQPCPTTADAAAARAAAAKS